MKTHDCRKFRNLIKQWFDLKFSQDFFLVLRVWGRYPRSMAFSIQKPSFPPCTLEGCIYIRFENKNWPKLIKINSSYHIMKIKKNSPKDFGYAWKLWMNYASSISSRINSINETKLVASFKDPTILRFPFIYSPVLSAVPAKMPVTTDAQSID